MRRKCLVFYVKDFGRGKKRLGRGKMKTPQSVFQGVFIFHESGKIYLGLRKLITSSLKR